MMVSCVWCSDGFSHYCSDKRVIATLTQMSTSCQAVVNSSVMKYIFTLYKSVSPLYDTTDETDRHTQHRRRKKSLSCCLADWNCCQSLNVCLKHLLFSSALRNDGTNLKGDTAVWASVLFKPLCFLWDQLKHCYEFTKISLLPLKLGLHCRIFKVLFFDSNSYCTSKLSVM